jgi:hypothetical protein
MNRKGRRFIRKQFLFFWNLSRKYGFYQHIEMYVGGLTPFKEDFIVYMLISRLFDWHTEAGHLSAKTAWERAEQMLPDILKITIQVYSII